MAYSETQLGLPLLVEWIQQRFEGVVIKNAYSELTFFYNPDHKLPNGVYFLTIKEKDGPNDTNSRLDRDGVLRLSFKPDASTYQKFFGDKPKRATKGADFNTGVDSSQLDTWLPHPVYAWMGWTMILSPSQKSLELLRPFIEESYLRAKKLFLKRVGEA
jgi:hypothetical protein